MTTVDRTSNWLAAQATAWAWFPAEIVTDTLVPLLGGQAGDGVERPANLEGPRLLQILTFEQNGGTHAISQSPRRDQRRAVNSVRDALPGCLEPFQLEESGHRRSRPEGRGWRGVKVRKQLILDEPEGLTSPHVTLTAGHRSGVVNHDTSVGVTTAPHHRGRYTVCLSGRRILMFGPRRFSPFWLVLAILGMSAAQGAAQQGSITGRVVDAETGAPYRAPLWPWWDRTACRGPTPQGTFQWRVPDGTHSLIVTLIGYETGRLDGVGVSSGETTNVEIALRSRAEVLNPIVVTASRRQEKALDAPASISSVSQAEIAKIAAPSIAEHVKALPGVDMAQTGLTQSNVVARGFNNVFSGAMLTIQDNRYASVPSLRFNANNMIPATDLDIERIEVSLGPGAALYGPNAASGVMHIITSSPIDRPGSSISLAGGERSVFHGQFRTAVAPSDRFGVKVSGQYFRGDDWEFIDPQGRCPANP